MAGFITKYSHTDYLSVLQMEYGMILDLYNTLVHLIEAENEERERHATTIRTKHGKR
jgi:hypothetical protein